MRCICLLFGRGNDNLWVSVSSILKLAIEDKKWLTGRDDQFISMGLLCFLPIMWGVSCGFPRQLLPTLKC